MKLRFSGFVDVVELVLGLVNPPILQYINCALNNNHRANDTHSDDLKPFKWEMCDRRENSRFLSGPNRPLLGAHWALRSLHGGRGKHSKSLVVVNVCCVVIFRKKLNLTFTISSSVIRFLPFVSPRLLLCWALSLREKFVFVQKLWSEKEDGKVVQHFYSYTFLFFTFFLFCEKLIWKTFHLLVSCSLRVCTAWHIIRWKWEFRISFHSMEKMSQWEGNLKKKVFNGSSGVVWRRAEEHGWM